MNTNKFSGLDVVNKLLCATEFECDVAQITKLVKILYHYEHNQSPAEFGATLESRDPLEFGIEISSGRITGFKYTLHSQRVCDEGTTNLDNTIDIINLLCQELGIDGQHEVKHLLNFIGSQTETGITSIYCSVTHRLKQIKSLRLYMTGGIKGIAFSCIQTLSNKYGLPNPQSSAGVLMEALCATNIDLIGLNIENNSISGLKLYISKPYFHADLLGNLGRGFQLSLRNYYTLFDWYRCFVSRASGRISIFGVGIDLASIGTVDGIEIYNYSDSDHDDTWLPRLKHWSINQNNDIFMKVLNNVELKPIGMSVGVNLVTNNKQTTLYMCS